jgi:hypothetical protein
MKKTKIFIAAVAVFLIVFTATVSAGEVTAWVPPYGISTCQTNLNASYGTYKAKDALTSISLQFWAPTSSGGLVFASGINATTVNWFTSWGRTNNVKVILTVYNGASGWDWTLATAAFAANRTAFVNALVSTMTTYGLDGVDIDLEGNGLATNDHRTEFRSFVNDLSAALKPLGKLLTVCSFSDNGSDNCPDQSWWPDWTGKVDFIRSMGYNEIYETNTNTRLRYSSQQNFGFQSGFARRAITMGVPAWLDTWGNLGTVTHLNECLSSCTQCAGVGLWDMQLQGSSWKTSAVWALLAQLKTCDPVPVAQPVRPAVEAKASNVPVVRSVAEGLDIAGMQNAVGRITVFNAAGRVLANAVPALSSIGSTRIPLNDTRGVIFVHIVETNGAQSVVRIVR